MVTSSSPERSNDQLLSAAINSYPASELVEESILLSRRDMPSRPCLLLKWLRWRYARSRPTHSCLYRVAANCNPSSVPASLRGSSDVICGIRATAPPVHPQAMHRSSTALRGD